MTKDLFAPCVDMPISVLTAHRAKHVRMLRMVTDSPKLYKRPTNVKRTCSEAIAQYDTALKVLRDVKRAIEKPRRRSSRKLNELDPGPARELPRIL